MNDNPSCQHHRIDNDTWQCEECGERMLTQNCDAETIRSAPNAAAGLCTIPECDGERAHGCTAVYVPDESRARTIVIGYDYNYECERCSNNGTVFDAHGVTWECGHAHRGERVPARTT